MKANVGDFVRTENGVRQVVSLDGYPGDPLAGYELSDGSVIADIEISNDDVLLGSEVGSALSH